MHIDPANSTPAQVPHSDKGYNIAMRDDRSLKQFAVIVKQLLAAAEITNEQLAMDQIVGRSLTHGEKPFEFGDEGLATHEEPNPNRCIDQYH
jgi:hypothetical protein